MFYTNPYVTVEFDPIIKCIIITFKGFVQGGFYKEGWNKGLELAKEKQAIKWLYNQKEQKVSNPDDTKWMLEDFYPQVIPTFKDKLFIAIVISEDVFEKVVTHNVLEEVTKFKQYGHLIEFKYFTSENDAKNWLLEK